MWDVATGRLRHSLTGHTGKVVGVACRCAGAGHGCFTCVASPRPLLAASRLVPVPLLLYLSLHLSLARKQAHSRATQECPSLSMLAAAPLCVQPRRSTPSSQLRLRPCHQGAAAVLSACRSLTWIAAAPPSSSECHAPGTHRHHLPCYHRSTEPLRAATLLPRPPFCRCGA